MSVKRYTNMLEAIQELKKGGTQRRWIDTFGSSQEAEAAALTKAKALTNSN
jgi:hypothetical protein